MPVWRFLKRSVLRAKEIEMGRTSVVVAYYVLLSLFPMVVTAVTVLPYANIDPESFLPYLQSAVPAPILQVIMPVIDNALTNAHGGVLSLGILGTLWSAGKGVHHLRMGVDRAYQVEGSSHYLTSRLLSLGTLIVTVLLLIVLTAAFSFGDMILNSIADFAGWTEVVGRTFRTLRWPVTFIALFLLLLMLYKFMPNIKTRFRETWAGALLASAGVLVLVQPFAWFLRLSNQSLTAYGILSAFFMLMLWLRIIAYLLLLGAVVNAALFESRGLTPRRKYGKVDEAIECVKEKALAKARTLFKKK